MDTNYSQHYSVLYKECRDAFLGRAAEKENPIFADMTFGGGGHTLRIAKEIPGSTFYSVDQDPDAIANGLKRIDDEKLNDRVNLLKMNFEEFPEWVSGNHSNLKFDGILADLGVSSHHFDKFERGFSFREDAPLDMRMDCDNQELFTAADIVNEMDEEDLANLIYKYGEEQFSRRISKNICEQRKTKEIKTTKELEEIIFLSYPKNLRHKKIHPATKTFQALRIAVNRELEVLENTIEKLYDMLDAGGVLAIISFHSLEDRIVKHKFKEISQTHKNIAKIITKKPIYPGAEELAENPRSRSAKLRILAKLD